MDFLRANIESQMQRDKTGTSNFGARLRSLLDERVDWQPIHINSPVRPPRSLPILLIVQTSWNVDFFPHGVEARFIEIDFSNLRSISNDYQTITSCNIP